MNLPITIRHGECKHIKIHHYPDGQKNITLDMEYFNNPKMFIDIKCSIRNFSELEILLCIIAALRKNDFFIESIEFVYLFGMRSDRAFEPGMPNYFRDVIAPIINNLNIPRIVVLQPHSQHIIGYLKNSTPTSKWLFTNEFHLQDHIIIGGDSSTIYYDFFHLNYHFDKIRINGIPSIYLKKEFVAQINQVSSNLPILIYDDLCDGGATFIAEADYLKSIFPNRKAHLFITHAIFSKGIDIVADKFESIICTNSYQDIDHPKVQQIKVI